MTIDLVLFDKDGTIIKYNAARWGSTWDAIGQVLGLEDVWKCLVKRYLADAEDPKIYEAWFLEACGYLRGKNVGEIINRLSPLPYLDGFKEFCAILDVRGIKKGIVSTGIDFVAEMIASDVNLDYVIANEVCREQGYFTGEGKLVVPLYQKGTVVRELIQRESFDPERVAYLGDSGFDRSSWKEVGLPLGMNLASEELKEHVRDSFNNYWEVLGRFPQLFL